MILEKSCKYFLFIFLLMCILWNDNVWLILFNFSYRENIIQMKINLN